MFSSKEIVETVRKRYPVGLEIVISVNGEYFDSEVSPAKIGTKEVQVLMDEVA